MNSAAYNELDDALAVLAPYDGLGNHGPMVAEALCALDRGDAAVAWTERYVNRFKFLQKRSAPANRVDDDDWRDALGKFDRLEDWSQFFSHELDESPWPDVLDRWVARLAPGFSAVALHGPIRTCHAVRALAERDSSIRRKELADGLAHWAAGFQLLPSGTSNRPRLLPSRAILEIETIPANERLDPVSLVRALKDLDDFRPFSGVIAEVELTCETDAILSDLTQTFAAAYLSNGVDFFSVFGFIHAVTGPSALRMIAPHVSETTLREALRYAWQAAAGLYARFGGNAPISEIPVDRFDSDGLIDRAVASDDEHAIKFTEACLREFSLNPRSAFIAAAPHAVDFLSRARGSS